MQIGRIEKAIKKEVEKQVDDKDHVYVEIERKQFNEINGQKVSVAFKQYFDKNAWKIWLQNMFIDGDWSVNKVINMPEGSKEVFEKAKKIRKIKEDKIREYDESMRKKRKEREELNKLFNINA